MEFDEDRVVDKVVSKWGDPVFVTEYRDSIELRIGRPRQGETRIAYLSHKAAEGLADLLQLASQNVSFRAKRPHS